MTNPQLCRTVAALADYAREKGLIQPDDHTWAVNRLLETLEVRPTLGSLGCSSKLSHLVTHSLSSAHRPCHMPQATCHMPHATCHMPHAWQ